MAKTPVSTPGSKRKAAPASAPARSDKGAWATVDTTGMSPEEIAALAEPSMASCNEITDEHHNRTGAMETYHYAWLSAHPERSEEWLAGILAQGFHIHHMDGDHHNDDPKNLVLIESGDHMMIHNGVARLLWKPKLVRKQKEKKPTKKSLQKAIAKLEVKLEEVEKQKQDETVSVSKADTKVFVDAFLRPTTPPLKLSREITASQKKEIAEFHKLMKMKVGGE